MYRQNIEQQKKLSFSGINGEALFVGSIIHSLDHSSAEYVLEDPFSLDATHEEFGLMALVGQLGRVGFTEKPPGQMFKKMYKDGKKGSFWRQVYEKASLIDKELADKMECGVSR